MAMDQTPSFQIHRVAKRARREESVIYDDALPQTPPSGCETPIQTRRESFDPAGATMVQAKANRSDSKFLQSILHRGRIFDRHQASAPIEDDVPLYMKLQGLAETSIVDLAGFPSACCQNPDTAEDIVAIGTDGGIIHLVNYSTFSDDGTPQKLTYGLEKRNWIYDLSWLSRHTLLVSASSGVLEVVDLIRGQSRSCAGHSRSVRSVTVAPESSNTFATSSRDGAIHVWDVRNSPRSCSVKGSMYWIPGRTIANAHGTPFGQSSPHSVTSVSYLDDSNLLASGGTDGAVKLWDLRMIRPVAQKTPTPVRTIAPFRDGISAGYGAVTSLSYSQSGQTLVSSHLGGAIITRCNLTVDSENESATLLGSGTDSRRSFHSKAFISDDGRYVTSAGADGLVDVWTLPLSGAPMKGWSLNCDTGTDTLVNMALWLRSSSERPQLAVIGNDNTVRLWETTRRQSGVAVPKIRVSRHSAVPNAEFTHRPSGAVDQLMQTQLDAFYPILG